MIVLVDYREPPYLVESIRALSDQTVEVKVAELEVGDIALTGDECTLIERKTIRDFLSSIWNNRIWGQLERLAQAEGVFGVPVMRRLLLIHGELDYYDNLNSAFGAILEAIYVYGVPVIWLFSDDELISFLKVELNREREGKNTPQFLPIYRRFRKREEDPRIYLLTSIPMIGPKTAQNLLEGFGSIADIANRSLKELQSIKGVGKKRAKLIFKLLH
jgi:ERCC4-type nuclease